MALGLNGNPSGFQERSTVQQPVFGGFGGSNPDLPEYSGLEQALLGQSQRAFTDPGGTLDLLRQQFSASGLGNSGVLLGAQQRADTQRQAGLAEQLAQLRVQRAMAQLEQRRFADQLGFQNFALGQNLAENQRARDFQSQQGELAFTRQQQLIQQQRAYEEDQQSRNFLGNLIGGGLGFLTGGIGGLLSGNLLGGNAGGRFLQGAFAGPGALAGAQLGRNSFQTLLRSYGVNPIESYEPLKTGLPLRPFTGSQNPLLLDYGYGSSR